jgi:hypothetical protein
MTVCATRTNLKETLPTLPTLPAGSLGLAVIGSLLGNLQAQISTFGWSSANFSETRTEPVSMIKSCGMFHGFCGRNDGGTTDTVPTFQVDYTLECFLALFDIASI